MDSPHSPLDREIVGLGVCGRQVSVRVGNEIFLAEPVLEVGVLAVELQEALLLVVFVHTDSNLQTARPRPLKYHQTWSVNVCVGISQSNLFSHSLPFYR